MSSIIVHLLIIAASTFGFMATSSAVRNKKGGVAKNIFYVVVAGILCPLAVLTVMVLHG